MVGGDGTRSLLIGCSPGSGVEPRWGVNVSDIEPVRSGLDRLFNRTSAVERQHQDGMAALARMEELAAEKIAAIHELARENMSQAFLGAAQRNAYIMNDPLGAETYFAIWQQACQESAQVIHRTARGMK